MNLPNASLLWGSDSLIKKWDWGETLMTEFYYFMMHHLVDLFWPFLIALHLYALVMAFFGKAMRFHHILVFITTIWLYNRLYLYVIGGNLLIMALLFYLIFANERNKDEFNFKLNQLILLACQIQICFVYFFSGLWKLAGTEWLSGEAMHFILNVPEYSHPWVMENIADKEWLTIPGTYFALVYQLLFPVLIWIKKIKKPLLMLGVFFHLFIGIAMGIWDFALIMIASYMAFWGINTKKEISYLT